MTGQDSSAPRRAHLSSVIPNLQVGWDSTSLGALKACPRYYQLTMLESWRPKSESHHLVFGIHFHAIPEWYDHRRVQGMDHETALRGAIRKLLLDTEGWVSEDSKKNRESLLRSVVWYLDHFRDDPLPVYILPNGKPAVELSFRFQPNITLGTGEEVVLCGHMDKVVEPNGRLYVADKKTSGSALGEYFFANYSPSNQMTLYTLAGKVVLERPIAGVIIDGAQIGVNFTRFARGFVNRTGPQLAEWMQDLTFWLRQAEFYAESNYWPQNDTACGMYGGCKFRGICSKDPAVRNTFLKGAFHKVEWNPLDSRGE